MKKPTANSGHFMLKSQRSPDIILEYMRQHTKPYNLINCLVNGWDILYRETGGTFRLYMSWQSEPREFRGTIYEDDDDTIIKGEFRVLFRPLIFRIVFWIFGWSAIIFILFRVSDKTLIYNMRWFFCGFCAFFLFDIWYLNFHRSRKYEKKITDFLRKCGGL